MQTKYAEPPDLVIENVKDHKLITYVHFKKTETYTKKKKGYLSTKRNFLIFCIIYAIMLYAIISYL